MGEGKRISKNLYFFWIYAYFLENKHLLRYYFYSRSRHCVVQEILGCVKDGGDIRYALKCAMPKSDGAESKNIVTVFEENIEF